MDFDRDSFYRKLEKEINRLHQTADRMNGPDKNQIKYMIQALEQECQRFRDYQTLADESEAEYQDKALALIIEILNSIESRVHDLEAAMGKEEPRFIGSIEEANRIVHQFFFECQVAEDRIKSSAAAGHITKKQRDGLNTQLQQLVHRMMQLSRKSEYLIDAVLQSYEARMFS